MKANFSSRNPDEKQKVEWIVLSDEDLPLVPPDDFFDAADQAAKLEAKQDPRPADTRQNDSVRPDDSVGRARQAV